MKEKGEVLKGCVVIWSQGDSRYEGPSHGWYLLGRVVVSRHIDTRNTVHKQKRYKYSLTSSPGAELWRQYLGGSMTGGAFKIPAIYCGAAQGD